jgi:hypothetical protein
MYPPQYAAPPQQYSAPVRQPPRPRPPVVKDEIVVDSDAAPKYITDEVKCINWLVVVILITNGFLLVYGGSLNLCTKHFELDKLYEFNGTKCMVKLPSTSEEIFDISKMDDKTYYEELLTGKNRREVQHRRPCNEQEAADSRFCYYVGGGTLGVALIVIVLGSMLPAIWPGSEEYVRRVLKPRRVFKR